MGLTPLHLAAAGGHADICTLLVGAFACSRRTHTRNDCLQVELNADITARDGVGAASESESWSQGLTPAGLAQAHGHLR